MRCETQLHSRLETAEGGVPDPSLSSGGPDGPASPETDHNQEFCRSLRVCSIDKQNNRRLRGKHGKRDK